MPSSSSTSSCDRCREKLGVEARAEDRGVPEDRAVRRGEPVDLSGDERPRPNRAARRSAPVARTISSSSKRNSALPAERRASSSTIVGRQRVVVGRRACTISAIRCSGRRSSVSESDGTSSSGGSPRRARVRVRDEQELTQAGPRSRQPQQEVFARLVDELDVLDGQHRRRAGEARRRGSASPRPRACSRRNRSSRLAVSGVGGRSSPSRIPSSGSHGTSVRVEPLPPTLPEPRSSPRVCPRAAREPEHLAHRGAERRSTASTTRTPRSAAWRTAASAAAVDQLLEEPRAAEPRLRR